MQYVCRLGTPEGKVVEQEHQARDESALRREMERRGYHVFSVRQKSGLGLLSRLRLSRRRKMKTEEFLIFNQEMAALLRAGLPLMQALDLMLERMQDPVLRPVLADIRDRVKAGEDLSAAFESYGDLFPRLYPSTLKAGERSGELESVIRRFIRYLRLVTDVRRRVVSALVYPAVLIGLSVGMLLVMALFVVPKFTSFYADLDAELPFLTQVVLGTVSVIEGNWLLILIAVVAAVFLIQQWKKTETGNVTFDRLKLRVPLVGEILRRFGLSEFCRSLSTLLSGGIPLVPASEIAVGGISNAHLRQRLQPVIKEIRQGQPFHKALDESGIFMDMAVDMVKVGEATGALDEMLVSVSDFLDQQVETRTQRLLSLVEPLLLVFMGVIIGILLVAIYLPLFSVLTQVGS